MKNVKEILSHIINTPCFSEMGKYNSYRTFKNILPKKYQEAIIFMYQKDRTLFLVLNHQGIHMELNYNRTLIKELLTAAKAYDKNLKEIDEVKWFVSNRVKKEDSFITRSIPVFQERADENLEFQSSDLEFNKRVEKIKEAIKFNRCRLKNS